MVRYLLNLAFIAGFARAVSAVQPADPVFTNPIVSRGADPWVIRWNSKYYYCHSIPNAGWTAGASEGVWVSVAANLEDIGQGPAKRVWLPKPGTGHSKEIWAPELHYLHGKWYIYVAADNGDNAAHRMYVLEGTSQDPQQPFVFKARIAAPSNRWAIDGTVLEMPDGKLYFIWSGWDGNENVAQNLYIAPMSNPWTISGRRVCISRPQYSWERNGLPINEGPETLWHKNRVFVIYSASGFWTDDYCLGELAWTGGDVMDPKSWIKKPTPVFAGTATVFGPGHCSFVPSPDGTEDWIVYHAHVRRGSGQLRDVRIQPFTWNADGSPDFGSPVSPGVPLRRPSGETR
ncbi:MAG TPA: glycoside hydrolase family 43 protein [Verrucomicrobiae bacterium]|nr:glycoside hydrolase family 43 protein [Verrucomicrobiae bacterium]